MDLVIPTFCSNIDWNLDSLADAITTGWDATCMDFDGNYFTPVPMAGTQELCDAYTAA